MMPLESPVSAILVASHVAQQTVEYPRLDMVTHLRTKRAVPPVEREEEQAFLPDEEQAGEDGETSLRGTKSLSRSTSPYTSLPIYSHIHL